jgi:N-acetylglutamate synthase-like GNAT family acetyltransferase
MTAPVLEIRIAGPDELHEIEGLLESSALTGDGLAECTRAGDVLVARADDGRLVGCVALELFGSDALVRSLAVTAGVRGHGLGGALLARALDHARAAGAREAWLLTETAAPFFAARGWRPADRATAPVRVAGSVEFTSACPVTVPAMRRTI